MQNKKFISVWQASNLDIRKTGNGRWYDQKVTPDIMAMICDVIVDYRSKNVESFTAKDLWKTERFETSMEHDFGKPPTKNPGARREYDKVILQPLTVLHLSDILILEKERPKKFRVNKKFETILHEMADSERKAVEFLSLYIKEVLRQSNLLSAFNDFFQQQDTRSFNKLKTNYVNFCIKHTKINTDVECRRVFAKILNIQAYVIRKRGTDRGKLSKNIISLGKIRYNQLNIRDIRNKKPKNVPRQQHARNKISVSIDRARSSRFAQRIINDVKAFHQCLPEIQDQYSATPNTSSAVQGHHIFTRSEFPSLSCFRENIIVLSATQHTGYAHAEFHSVSPAYQLLCLLKKLEAIEACENDPNCNFYSFREFKKILTHVGIINAENGAKNDNELATLNYDDVRRIITGHYAN